MRQIVQFLANGGLFFDEAFGLGLRQIGLLRFVAEFFLLVDQLARQGDAGMPIGAKLALRIIHFFEQQPQALDDPLLTRRRFGIAESGQFRSGRVELLAYGGGLKNLQSLGRPGPQRAAPLADVGERFHQLQKELLDVSLVFDRGQRQPFLPSRKLIGDRAGRLPVLGLGIDQPLHLGGDFGRFEASQQILPLGRQSRDDLTNHLPGLPERIIPLGLGPALRFHQQFDGLFHLFIDEGADIFPHQGNVAVQRKLLEPVLFQLLQLNVEHAGQQLPGHIASPLLGVLLATEGVGIDGAGAGRSECEQQCHNDNGIEN